MEFYHYFRSVKFVVLTGDQFVGRDDGPLEQQNQQIVKSIILKRFKLLQNSLRFICFLLPL